MILFFNHEKKKDFKSLKHCTLLGWKGCFQQNKEEDTDSETQNVGNIGHRIKYKSIVIKDPCLFSPAQN